MSSDIAIRVVAMISLMAALCAYATPARVRGKRGKTASGMVIEAPFTGKRVRIVDGQRRVGAEVFEAIAKEFAETVWFKVERVHGATSPKTVLPDDTVGLVVRVEDCEGTPTLLIAPENGWAKVNIAGLATDNPNADILSQRVRRAIWRAVAYVLGAGNERLPSVLSPIETIADLDKLPPTPTPEAFNTILHAAEVRGIGKIKFVTYHRACDEGWAPAPTNDVQRAIWEKVKADKERGPTNPIKIDPPNAKK